MKKNIFIICMAMAAGCITTLTAQVKNAETLVPLTKRVNVQADTARLDQIIDGCWVAVGTNKKHAIQRDFTRLFAGNLLTASNCAKRITRWKDTEREKPKGVPSFLIVTPPRPILRGCRQMLIVKRKSLKPYIIMAKVFVRKEFHAIMSFLCIFHLLWIVMSPRFLPSGMVCPTARLCRLLRVK